MQKKIIRYVTYGRTKEALNLALTLCLKQDDAKTIYNDLILASNQLYRVDQDYFMSLISSEERDKTHTCVTSYIIECLPLLKKNVSI